MTAFGRLLAAAIAVTVLACAWTMYQTPVMGLILSEAGFCR